MKRTLVSLVFLSACLAATACGTADSEISHAGHEAGGEILAAADIADTPEATAIEEAHAEEPHSHGLPERRILAAEGVITIDGEEAQVGDELGTDIELRTSKEGGAVITLGKGGLVDIGPDTTFRIGSSARAKTSLELALGTLWSFLPTGSDFEVVTANAVAGVRGTIFFVDKEENRHSYVCACHGKVAIHGKGRAGKNKFDHLAFSPHQNHKAFDIRGRRLRTRARSAERRDHSEDRKMELMPYMEEVGYEMTSYE